MTVNRTSISKLSALFIWMSIGIYGYNIETRSVNTISPDGIQDNSWFGYSLLLQPESNGELSIFASSPLYKKNITSSVHEGAIHKCSITSNSNSFSCKTRSIDDSASLGMSMVQSKDKQLVVCGPQWEYKCRNAHIPLRMIGSCYVMNSSDISSNKAEKLPSPCETDCPGGLDIVFLVDSSGSVTEDNFNKTKDWLIAIMEGFREGMEQGEVNVGVIQYSGTTDALQCNAGNLERLISIELSLGSYDLATARAKVLEAERLRKCTLTGDSINATVGEFLLRGRKENAAVMIVITDGRSSDDVMWPSIHAKRNGINMIAVGIGKKFVMSELEIIADNNASIFTVESFANLGSILTGLQQAILLASTASLEGSSGNSTTELTQCMMGTSAYISKENNLHLGAIGANDNKGTIISRTLKDVGKTNVISEKVVKSILNTRESLVKDSYLGYSIIGGHFTGSEVEWIATGIPRYLKHGAILLYQTKDIQNYHLLLPPTGKTGRRQIGTYFGHTLCAADVSKKGVDDLIVGAPLHTNEGTSSYDEGSVFIYRGKMSAKDMSFMIKPSCTLQNNLPSSRYGMSIVSAGDLDRDEYNDFIVGAPGANENLGEIIVYYGTKNCPTRHQRISPTTFGSQLQYFGYSIALLNNPEFSENPIIVSSSPISQKVLSFRARPVIELKVEFAINSEHGSNIDVIQCAKDQMNKVSCGIAKICFQVAWRDNSQKKDNGDVDFEFDMELDSDYKYAEEKRMLFEINGQTNNTISIERHPVTTDRACVEYSIVLKPDVLTAVDAVDFSRLLHTTLKVKISEFVRNKILSPVMTVDEIVVEKQINLTKGCISSGSCSYDLALSVQIPSDDPFKLNDASEVMNVNVTLVNKGGPAFFTKLHVYMINVVIVHVKSTCAFLEDDRQTISYRHKTFGSLHMTGESCDIKIRFGVTPLARLANETELMMNISAYSLLKKDTEAEDITPNDNSVVIQKSVMYRSSFAIIGEATPSDMRYWRNTTNVTTANSLTKKGIFAGEDGALENSFTIRNTGPFLVTTADINFTWPAFTVIERLPLLYLYSFACKPESACACDQTNLCKTINPRTLPYDNLSISDIRNRSQCSTTPNTTLTESSMFNITLPGTFYVTQSDMTCEQRNGIFVCNTIQCQLSNIKPNQVVEVKAKFKFWIPTFRFKKGVEDTTMYIGSNIVLDLSKVPIFPTTIYKQSAITSTQQYLETRVSPKPPEQEVDVTTMLIAMFVGLAIVGICTIICWKCGFFESKYKKNMEEFILAEEEEELVRSFAADKEKIRGMKKKNSKKKVPVGEGSIQMRYTVKLNEADTSSMLNAEEEFVRATSSPRKRKLSVPKDDLYLEMSPMRDYRKQKKIFEANTTNMLEPVKPQNTPSPSQKRKVMWSLKEPYQSTTPRRTTENGENPDEYETFAPLANSSSNSMIEAGSSPAINLDAGEVTIRRAATTRPILKAQRSPVRTRLVGLDRSPIKRDRSLPRFPDYSFIFKEEEEDGKVKKATMTITEQKKQRMDSTRL